MFYRLNVSSLDLSSFDTSSVTNMYNMFNSCEKLKTIYVSSKWTVGNVEENDNMFGGCTSLQGDIPYNADVVGITYATPTGGYLTLKTNFVPEKT